MVTIATSVLLFQVYIIFNNIILGLSLKQTCKIHIIVNPVLQLRYLRDFEGIIPKVMDVLRVNEPTPGIHFSFILLAPSSHGPHGTRRILLLIVHISFPSSSRRDFSTTAHSTV